MAARGRALAHCGKTCFTLNWLSLASSDCCYFQPLRVRLQETMFHQCAETMASKHWSGVQMLVLPSVLFSAGWKDLSQCWYRHQLMPVQRDRHFKIVYPGILQTY